MFYLRERLHNEDESPAPAVDDTTPAVDDTTPAVDDTTPAVDDTTPAVDDVKPNWPDDWRTLMAAGDEKELARLQRFGSPKDVYGSFRQMETKMSDGTLRSNFPVDGSDEDKTAWRKANGVPETADGYHEMLDDGLVIGEDDKPFLDSFFESAAAENMRPNEVNKAVAWYFSMQEQLAIDRQETDTQARQATDTALKAEWGGEYKPNINAIHGLLDLAPGEVKDTLLNARDSEGVPIFSNPDVVKYMAHLSREINPTGIPIPEGGTNAIGSMEARVQEITEIMRNSPDKYWKNQAMQDELYKLNQGLERLKPAA